MSASIKTILLWLCVAILCLCGVFYAGFRYGQTQSTQNTVEYVKGDTITDSLFIFKPYQVIRIDTISNEYKVFDTVTNVYYVDTAKIIEQFTQLVKYREKLFDSDTLGSLSVDVNVQYNRLQKIGYNFTPIQKVVTKSVSLPKFGVYTSVNSFGSIGIGAIGEYKQIGGTLQYVTQERRNGIQLGFFYVF